jgi:hypothetical protein
MKEDQKIYFALLKTAYFDEKDCKEAGGENPSTGEQHLGQRGRF